MTTVIRIFFLKCFFNIYLNLLLSLYIKLSQVRSMYKLLAVCVSLSLPLRLLLFLFIPDMRYDCARSYTSLPHSRDTQNREATVSSQHLV